MLSDIKANCWLRLAAAGATSAAFPPLVAELDVVACAAPLPLLLSFPFPFLCCGTSFLPVAPLLFSFAQHGSGRRRRFHVRLTLGLALAFSEVSTLVEPGLRLSPWPIDHHGDIASQ